MLKLYGRTAKLRILLSDTTPVNLIGRDALGKLGLQILCTPQGIMIEPAGTASQMILPKPDTANVYWIGRIQDQVEETMGKWGSYIKNSDPTCKGGNDRT